MKVVHSKRAEEEKEKEKQVIHDSIMDLAKNFPLTEKEKRDRELINKIIENTKSF